MTIDLARERLRNQRLTRTDFGDPAAVVAWLGAVQAQDYPAARWALGLRAIGVTDAAVEQAFDEGAILRLHILRPTWHFVHPADLRWMLALSAPRVHTGNASYYRKFELDSRTFTRSRVAIERALRGGKQMTRAELALVIDKAGIPADRLRLAYLMMHAELEGVICSGARRGKQFTYALLDERVPAARTLDPDEALAELTRRYFSSHGPATVRDFVWWSGLTVRQARMGIELAGQALVQQGIGDRICWLAPSASAAPPASPSAHLLPIYDEFLIAYRDRGPVTRVKAVDKAPAGDAGNYGLPPGTDAFAHPLVVDGQLAGTWRRTLTKHSVLVNVVPSRPLTRTSARALAAASERYGRFMNLAVTLSIT